MTENQLFIMEGVFKFNRIGESLDD